MRNHHSVSEIPRWREPPPPPDADLFIPKGMDRSAESAVLLGGSSIPLRILAGWPPALRDEPCIVVISPGALGGVEDRVIVRSEFPLAWREPARERHVPWSETSVWSVHDARELNTAVHEAYLELVAIRHHKRRRPKNARAGCLLCHGHKQNGLSVRKRTAPGPLRKMQESPEAIRSACEGIDDASPPATEEFCACPLCLHLCEAPRGVLRREPSRIRRRGHCRT